MLRVRRRQPGGQRLHALDEVSLGTPMRHVRPAPRTSPSMAPNDRLVPRHVSRRPGSRRRRPSIRATGRMYVGHARTLEGGKYFQRLHALDILTGKDVAGSPIDIAGSVPGTAPGRERHDRHLRSIAPPEPTGPAAHRRKRFTSRSASHCDDEPYHGWVFAYAAGTLAQKAIFCTTPNGGPSMSGAANAGMGGIWQSGMGLVADGSDIYFASATALSTAATRAPARHQPGPAAARVDRLQSDGLVHPVGGEVDERPGPRLHDRARPAAEPEVILMGGKDQYLNVFDPANIGKYNAAAT